MSALVGERTSENKINVQQCRVQQLHWSETRAEEQRESDPEPEPEPCQPSRSGW